MKILFIEDTAADADLTKQALDLSVPLLSLRVVSSCRAALELLSAPSSAGPFDLVLSDLRLADGSGLEVLNHIRRHALALAVVLILAGEDEASLKAALKAGVDDVVIKSAGYLQRLPAILQYAWQQHRERAAPQADQESLQASETRFRRLDQEYHALLDAIPDGLTLHTPDLKIVWANREAIRQMGGSAEKVIGVACCELFLGRSHPLEDCPVALSFQHGQAMHDADFLAANRHWDIRTLAIKDEQGIVDKVIRISRDITETQILAQQLRQSQKMEAMGNLAGGIAHDFNNILAAILGFTELTLQRPQLDRETRINLHEIFKAGLRAKELVQQIMTFGRQVRQQFLPINAETIVTEALKLLRSTLPATIAITTRFQSRGIFDADANQIHQVIMNLCTNAAHAMRHKGGTLTIALEDLHLDANTLANRKDLRPGEYVCLTIQDTGHGMASEITEHIFEPYFTTKAAGEGSGLGLAVVHGIVNGHRGTISVDSRVGEGTIFTLFFPASFQKPLLGEAVSTVGQLPGGSENILFVDDEEILAHLGEQMLGRLGYYIKACTSADIALSLIKTDPLGFDLLISDLTMPDMTGLDLATACKQIRPDLPVIICTGYGSIPASLQSKDTPLAIDAVITKPVRLQELAATIRKVLDAN